MAPETCPNCGAEVPRNAKACPECGSDEKTGWSDESYASGLGLPDEEEFNYEEFVDREFGRKKKMVPRGLHWMWWLTAIAIVLLMLLFWLR